MVIEYDCLFIEVLEVVGHIFCACDCAQLALDGICLDPFINRGTFSWAMVSLKGRSSSSMALVDQASTRSAWQEFIYIFANSISLTYSLSDAGIERYFNRAFH